KLEIRFMFRAASPASRRPALSPTRGSAEAGVAGRSCAPPSITTTSMTADRHRHATATDLISAPSQRAMLSTQFFSPPFDGGGQRVQARRVASTRRAGITLELFGERIELIEG